MDFNDISIFLELANTKSVSATAERMFLSQSTISSRLKRLEQELGGVLFERDKGTRGLRLTAFGKEYLPLAENFSDLNERMLMMRGGEFTLRLASNESFYFEVLQPFLLEFQQTHSELSISVVVKDSDDIYKIISGGAADFGFASYDSTASGLNPEKIYTQSWCIISYDELKTNAEGKLLLSELKPENEIYYSLGDLGAIYNWRQQYLKTRFCGKTTVNGYIESVGFLRRPGSWEMASRRYASIIQARDGFNIYTPEVSPADRSIYMLTGDLHKRPIETEFLEGLKAYIENING